MFFTKTFTQNVWYRWLSPGVFDELPREETGEPPSIDTQVKEWVVETGNEIVHPGQLGMHTSWMGDDENPYQFKCLTFGLTVLYQEGNDDKGRRATS